MIATYIHREWSRTVRNHQFFTFSLLLPLVLLLLIAGPNRHEELGGLPFATYYTTGMVAWGAMAAVIAGEARIAADRTSGWNQVLRTTPLRPWVYLSSKVVTGYGLAGISITGFYVAGILLGVRMSAGRWAEMTVLVLIGLVPFAALGVAIGHLVGTESMGPAMGGITSILALLGGAWGPVAENGLMHTIAESLPSYWLVRSGQVGAGRDAWPLAGWTVVAGWAIALTWLAVWAYRRDTRKV